MSDNPTKCFDEPGARVLRATDIFAGLAACAWLLLILLVASGREGSYVGLAIAFVSVLSIIIGLAWDHYGRLRALAATGRVILADQQAAAELAREEREQHHADIVERLDAMLADLAIERKAREGAAAEEKQSAMQNLEERLAAGPRPINGERYPRAVPADR